MKPKTQNLKPYKMSRKPFKKSSESSPPDPAPSLLLEDDDPAFPRGGNRLLSREEVAEARNEADAEFEKEKHPGTGKRKKRSGAGKSGRSLFTTQNDREQDGDLWSIFGDGTTGKLPRFVNKISLKNISPNMKLWGVVTEVNPKDIVISLPGGLRGFVRLEDASDMPLDIEMEEAKDDDGSALMKLVHFGQLVPCVVLQVDGDKNDSQGIKRIWLSLRLSLLYKGFTSDSFQDGMALTAQIKSIEDHGCILSFGVPGFSGFLPRSKDGGVITRCQLVTCVVKSVDKARCVVHLSADSELVSKSTLKDIKGLSVDHLIPGLMVHAYVHSTLENGLMMSFLSYFTGTVDLLHLPNNFPSGNWKDNYSPNKKVNARILFVDPATRAVGLTLKPSLVQNKMPPVHVRPGDIFDESKILRIDEGYGLFLEIPSSPVPSSGFVSVNDVSDAKVSKLEKIFKEGSNVRVRVFGVRNMEGLAICTMKASASDGSVFTHSDVKPGMIVKAKIIAVEIFGAIVQFSSGIKALCPIKHMSELDIIKPPKKFQVGIEFIFRVLGCKSKRITVTCKKTLVKSKLDVLASYADATEGLVTHGWITKIGSFGCFVRFYNGVQGFAHRSELGLEPGVEAKDFYHVGQVIKCRVVNAVPAAKRIIVSFVISPKSYSDGQTLVVGTVVSGVVERITPVSVIVKINGHVTGTILDAHLADNAGQATLLKSLIKPGYEFDQLLVLDNDSRNVCLSSKHSLLTHAEEIPRDILQLNSGAVVHGYVCNLIESGCFVRYLGKLTGFSPKVKATDQRMENLSNAFYVGQSVRSHILNVDTEAGRIRVSLQQSLCSSTDTSFIQGYFLLEDKIAALQHLNSGDLTSNWADCFSIGTLVEGKVEEIKDEGVVLGFEDNSNIVGFISSHHLSDTQVDVGAVVTAFVLDVSKGEYLVDLSLRSEFVSSTCMKGSKKKRRRDAKMDLEMHQEVNAVVELVKDNYMVLSIPEYNYAIGYAAISDYNRQKLPNKKIPVGKKVVSTIGALPGPASSGRLLLVWKSAEVLKASKSKKAKKELEYKVGSFVEAEVVGIKALELIVKFGACRGRVHITEVLDEGCYADNPFSKYKLGDVLHARIIDFISQKKIKGYKWELSLRPSVLQGHLEESDSSKSELEFTVGSRVTGYVVRVDNEWIWLTVSRNTAAHMFILDSSCEPSELQQFQQRYKVGEAVEGWVISVCKEKNLLRIKQLDKNELCEKRNIQTEGLASTGAEHIRQADIVGGRIMKILPGVGGILVQIGPHLYGKVHYTELVDAWELEPLSGYSEGQFVKCSILNIDRTSKASVHVDVSLRSSLVGGHAFGGHADNMKMCYKRFEKIDDLKPEMEVQGYVKDTGTKGCFVLLSRSITARVLLSNLSDDYVKNLHEEFPVGKLVKGRILSLDTLANKVEMALRTNVGSAKKKVNVVDLSKLHEGDLVRGQIKRVELYGLFISIDNTESVGLCHSSELSDVPIRDLSSQYGAGDKVRAVILKIDVEKNRISLGMKESYLNAANCDDFQGEKESDDEMVSEDDPIVSSQNYNVLMNGFVSGAPAICAENGSRISIPPLQVSLEESDISDNENSVPAVKEVSDVTDALSKKLDKQAKKKAKEQREVEISKLEERALQKDLPRSADEFEKLVRSSPNSSFVWINYMAFMLDLGDVERARAVAERALKTINMQEEGEKLNIWVAYFNLENDYGKPPEESVKKMFQRALQHCDHKRLYFALLGVYERTKQHKLAEELIEKMIKKFRSSCKVWVSCLKIFLDQKKDEASMVVNRALLSLPRHKHIKLITKAAILEYKIGVPDRGRALFEGMLREYPKRTDLWMIYLDREISLGEQEVIRALFERVICLSLPPRKMKSLFKKYLQYEKTHGDESTIEHVKGKAREYAESALAV